MIIRKSAHFVLGQVWWVQNNNDPPNILIFNGMVQAKAGTWKDAPTLQRKTPGIPLHAIALARPVFVLY